ncbi:hypothetical protein NDU88_007360 [Pleurodeles waltl]|uniref:Uncharacterized protein n=1 Tax=Pleurodeles waltl TaxID=8319 RepID=A0AAV7SSP2_PLEWA|nr:hypothetical protein NDU88_007360 [Pleurodeles waltl]
MKPQSKIHRHAVSAGVGRAQSEQGLTLSPTRLFRSVRAQARLETRGKTLGNTGACERVPSGGPDRYKNIDRARARKSLPRVYASATRNAEEKRSGTLERAKECPLVDPTGIKISIALGLEKAYRASSCQATITIHSRTRSAEFYQKIKPTVDHQRHFLATLQLRNREGDLSELESSEERGRTSPPGDIYTCSRMAV